MTVRPGIAPSRRPASPYMRRRGAVYGIPTQPVDEHGRVIVGPAVVGYIGKSRQTVKQREGQHRDSQSFSDLIVGGSWTIEEGFWTDAELAEREEYYIRNGVALVLGQAPQRPIYNYEHNLDNPNRIEIWRAIQHRQLREPGWQPPPKDGIPRQPMTLRFPARPVAAPSALSRWWLRRRWWVIGLTGMWVAFLAGWCRFLALTFDLGAVGTVQWGACGATAPFALVTAEIARRRVRAWWRRVTRPKRRSSSRRYR